jgi:gamma-glutamyltranspeptidase / glutathione hydrolase
MTERKQQLQTPHGSRAGSYRPVVAGRNGMVAAGHPLAAQAGLRVLAAGGNAVDAAIAVAAALNVVEPNMSGIGGDGFLQIYWAADGGVQCLNGTGPAPRAASRERYLPEGIPPHGIRSVSVPGLIDAWCQAHARNGVLPLATALEPAIGLAEEGFPVSAKLAQGIAGCAGQPLTSFPTSAAVFAPGGRPLAAGERLVQRDLGRAFRRLAAEGSEPFYRGDIAREIVRFSRELGGFLEEDDLAAFRARWQEPIRTSYRGREVYEFPPNSSGHVLLQELNLVERFDLAALGWNTAASVHLMVEAKKLAFADRERYMADPDFVKVPIEGLLSKEYAAERAALIDPERAQPDPQVGQPEGREETTCFCVVDRAGNAVCQLQSLQSGFGAQLIAGDTGILLNNRMTYWHLEEDHVDCLQPGKRVRHTMNTVMVFEEGRLRLVCGTPGADTQVQTNLQMVTAVVDFGLDAQEIVEAPRWRHCQNGTESTWPHTCPDELLLEARFDEATRAGLAARGHAVRVIGPWEAMGSAMAIEVAPEGALFGGADPRRDGYAAGF